MELCVFKIGEDIKHLNDFVVSTKFELGRFVNISVHFEGANTVNHILELTSVVSIINCFNRNTTKIVFSK